MSQYKMVALDMDGTLLNNKHEISEHSAQALKKLSEKGVMIVIATGRSSGSVTKYVTTALAQLQQQKVPMIVFNGSVCIIRDQQTGEFEKVFSNTLTLEAVRDLIRMTSEENLVLQFYNGETGEVFVNPRPGNEEHLALVKRYGDLVGKPQTVVEDYEDLLAAGILPVKILALTPESKVDEVFAKPLSVNLHRIRGSPHPFFVEYLMPGNTKGTAIASLCQRLGVGLGEVVAFGDGENDAEMLEAVGLGVAMKNASPTAKESANEVTSHINDDDGVARHLEGLFGLLAA